MNSYSDLEWKFYFHLLPFNLKSCQTFKSVYALQCTLLFPQGTVCHCQPKSNTSGCADTASLAANHKLSEVVGPPEEWWIVLRITSLPPFRKDDEGSRQGAFCLRSFLDLPWPNEESNTNFRKRLLLPENEKYYSEILWKKFDQGRIFWDMELQIWKTAPLSIWNVFQMKELIKESKSADCKNCGTFRLPNIIFSVSCSL